MEVMKRLLRPLAVLLLAALAGAILETYVKLDFMDSFMIVWKAVFLFLFGMMLTARKRRSSAVFSKVIAIVVALVFLTVQLELLHVGWLANGLHFLGIEGIYYWLVYVLCGWLFME